MAVKSVEILKPLLIAAVFVALLYPYYSDYVAFHPDERHYTNAAITMNQTGDWLTPKYPDGTNRFIKPPITYWTIAGSYSVFGIGPLSSRLPFALISAAIIVLTYWLANGIAATRSAGWLAGWIMASNLFLVQATGRAIPDLPLTLFLLISAAGWLNWMTAEKSARWAPWAAYAGAGLAVASKGLPAGVFLGLSAVFAWLNPWRPLGLLRILHVPAIALGAVLGLGWFLAMYWIHGDAALSAFFSDQVGKRVDFDFLKAAGQWLLSLLAMVIGFLPWLWPARKTRRAAWMPGSGRDRNTVLVMAFSALWAVTMLFLMAAVVKFHARYMLPVLPLLAVSLALALERREGRHLEGYLAPAIVTVLAINLVLLVLLSSLLYLLEGYLPIWEALALLALTALLAFAGIVGSRQVGIATLGSSVLLLFTTAFTLLGPAVLPSESEQISAALKNQGVPPNAPVGLYGSPRLAAKIRVAAGGEISLVERSVEMGLAAGDAAIVLANENRDLLRGSGYSVRASTRSWDSLPLGDLRKAMESDEMERFRDENSEVYLIALPDSTQPP